MNTPDNLFDKHRSGIVTSGMGYTLWYSILPKLDRSIAAIAQLTVPLIAVVGGMVFLSEAITVQFALSATLIMGGSWPVCLGWAIMGPMSGIAVLWAGNLDKQLLS